MLEYEFLLVAVRVDLNFLCPSNLNLLTILIFTPFFDDFMLVGKALHTKLDFGFRFDGSIDLF